MVTGQCQLEANVVACVPDVAGLMLDPRDAHRVAPPSVAARRRRSATSHPPDSDLIGPVRIDSTLLHDMGAFIAAEVYGPWDASGSRPRVSAHDGAATYADGRWPASDAWTTALRRAWMTTDDHAAGSHWSVARPDVSHKTDPPSGLVAINHAQAETPSSRGTHVDAWAFDDFFGHGAGIDYDHAQRVSDEVMLHRPMHSLSIEGAHGNVHSSADKHHRHRHHDDDFFYHAAAPDHDLDGHDNLYKDHDDSDPSDAYGHDDDDDDDNGAYSNSDAELSDDERRADARHRLLHRRYRRADSPPG
ncbi:papain family cysteine protease [Pandoravirus inopinatum]|uniref:Papain family cysteine protease n=1 Tax=Pandoravirus inopinatum TaxID=1605721 RepID=A0A0B5IYJ0_9VIRU|nr:papain family cysteine protease [Pandoravirus inopinatum]AJF97953.1 papain family cysteine protease [Pandoravirus inopinatum]